MRYKLTRQELSKSRASDFAEGDIVNVGSYDIYIRYTSKDGQSRYDIPGLCSYVEKNWVVLDCTPGIELPYYIDDFLGR